MSLNQTMSTKYQMNDLKSYINKHIEEYPGIMLIYLFGSYANNNQKKNSDIDIAVFVSPKQYTKDAFDSTKEAYSLATNIGLVFNRQTDVIILNSSSIEMSYQIITNARVLYDENIDCRLEYEARIIGMYFDFMPFINQLRSK